MSPPRAEMHSLLAVRDQDEIRPALELANERAVGEEARRHALVDRCGEGPVEVTASAEDRAG
jgi:hypothetical protein